MKKIIVIGLFVMVGLLVVLVVLLAKCGLSTCSVQNTESSLEVVQVIPPPAPPTTPLSAPFLSENVRVVTPLPGSVISSPLRISGEALGSWYFEATFPIVLLNDHGVEIARTQARATKDWMTTEFVPFEAELSIPEIDSKQGTLVFEKDNPSGLPENADEAKFPILFR